MKHSITLIFTLLFLSFLVQAQQSLPAPRYQKAVYFDVSPPLRDMVKALPQKYDGSWKDGVVKNQFADDKDQSIPKMAWLQDPSIQDEPGALLSDTTVINVDGLGNGGGYVPPDTHGEIGMNHFFQVVNCSYAIFNKSGNKIFGPYASASIWSGLPNNSNDGDAVVLYDEQAARWFFSQFSLPHGSSYAPFYMMIAVSQTPDPMGSWYRYQYIFYDMPDYPKFGVWPDGYYMSINSFGTGGAGWVGNGACCFDRTAMLAGDPDAAMISFTVAPGADGFISLLPSDCDGNFPAYGTPNYFTFVRTDGPQKLGVYEFHADWVNPANSAFGNIHYLPVNPFSTIGSWGDGIPQLGTDKKLDPLADRLMFRQQYRKFGAYSSMVLNHTIDAGSGVAGIRWYELRNTGSGWSIYQQSTYAPADGHSRWMGSIAQDTAGTIAMGYSVSSAAMHPAIRYTGRLKADPLNQMTIAERVIKQGGGSQTGIWSGRCRWGDYSAISVDPAAPTTFWYTTEYYPTSSSSSWQTRIASFSYANVFSSAASATPAIQCSTATDSVQLNAYGYGGSGSYAYSWTSIPAGFTSNLKSPKVKPDISTKYIAAVSDGSQVRHDTVSFKLVPAPEAYAGDDTTVCWYVSPVYLNSYAYNYNKIAWATSGDGHFTDPTSPNSGYIPGMHDKTSGSVILRLLVTPFIPCTNNSLNIVTITLDPCTAIPENESQDLSISLSPNPAHGMTKLTVRGISAESTADLLSLEGIRLMTITLRPDKDGVSVMNLDLSGYPAGTYILQLQDRERRSTVKLVIY